MSLSQDDKLEENLTQAGPGLKIPPPLFYMISFFIGIGLNFLWPFTPIPRPWGIIIGAILIITSIPIMPPVLKRYKKAGTPFDVRKPTTKLITDGPYQYSRNPTYLSLTLLYLGLGLIFNNGWILLLVLPLILLMNFRVIKREEIHLQEAFGEEFLQYKSKVRRWI